MSVLDELLSKYEATAAEKRARLQALANLDKDKEYDKPWMARDRDFFRSERLKKLSRLQSGKDNSIEKLNKLGFKGHNLGYVTKGYRYNDSDELSTPTVSKVSSPARYLSVIDMVDKYLIPNGKEIDWVALPSMDFFKKLLYAMDLDQVKPQYNSAGGEVIMDPLEFVRLAELQSENPRRLDISLSVNMDKTKYNLDNVLYVRITAH